MVDFTDREDRELIEHIYVEQDIESEGISVKSIFESLNARGLLVSDYSLSYFDHCS